MPTVLQFKPIYRERVWGGRELAVHLGRKLPGAGPIGESWELVDRPEAQSCVVGGPWAGRTLRQLLEANAAEIMGPGWLPGRPFPILVKWLDCRDRLSVQVHPPAGLAARLGGEPKTENWYFSRTDPGAAVYAGLRAGVTAKSFAEAIAAGTVDRCLERLAVQPGDSLLIPSGTLHAINAGNVILEIQQNSDTTYRVFDWGRRGLDGKPRKLHLRESLECLGTAPAGPVALKRGAARSEVLADCDEFKIRREQLEAGMPLSFKANEQARILSVVEGIVATGPDAGPTLGLGDNALLPYSGEFSFVAKSKAVLLVTENFSHR